MDGADTRVLIAGEDPLARGGLTVLRILRAGELRELRVTIGAR